MPSLIACHKTILHRIVLASLVAITALTAFAEKAFAQGAVYKGRVAVVNREKVRSMIVVAMSDGRISPHEQLAIARRAKDTLAPEEAQNFQNAVRNLVAHQQSSDLGPNHGISSKINSPDPDGHLVGQVSDSLHYDSHFEENMVDSAGNCGSYTGAVSDWYGACGLLDNVRAFGAFDGFRGPTDIASNAGNFGFRIGLNGGFRLFKRNNIGIQAGTAQIMSRFHGAEDGSTAIRSQNFTTVGFFRRGTCLSPQFSWGFVYDFLYDKYYDPITIGQWRLKFAYQLTDRTELGVWTCIPGHGDSVPQELDGAILIPMAQASGYWRFDWDNGVTTTGWLGLAEKPGGFILGADAEVPLTSSVSLTGAMQYINPLGSGSSGQYEESWNMSVGIAFTPGAYKKCGRPGKFTPFLPVADNSTVVARRKF